MERRSSATAMASGLSRLPPRRPRRFSPAASSSSSEPLRLRRVVGDRFSEWGDFGGGRVAPKPTTDNRQRGEAAFSVFACDAAARIPFPIALAETYGRGLFRSEVVRVDVGLHE